MRLFSYNLESEFHRNFFVEVDFGGVVTCFFNRSYNDNLAVNFDAFSVESFGDLNVVNRAEYGTCFAGFSSDFEVGDSLDLSCESFGIGFDFSEFVSALALVLGKDFKSRRRRNYGFELGDEVIATVTRLHFNDVVLVSKALYVFNQNNFHIYISV